TVGRRARAVARARRRDVAAGAAQMDSLRRAGRSRDPGDEEPGARAVERGRGRAALARPGRAGARGAAGGVKPDESRLAYDGRLIDVTVERWGENEREIVEHPGAVAIVAVESDGMVALVRQPREAARKDLLELPAVTLEEGEAPFESARRELAEETGLTGGRWRELTAFFTTPGFCREHMHVFVAEGVERGDASPEDDEELELVRWRADEIAARLGEIEDAKTLAGLLLSLRETQPMHKVG